jgi:predicted AlkP superfamily pyrophosphatase or phosphodiesterase
VLGCALGLAAVATWASTSAASSTRTGAEAQGRHVLLISVDGLHASDLAAWIAEHPDSTLAKLAARGTTYPQASTTVPSDSFPGLLALVTGGTPKSTGVYYDDSYDRTLFAPGNTTCSGSPGTEVVYDESVDVNPTPPLSYAHTTIDPAQLPRQKSGSTCTPLYPHSFLRVNTIFNVARDAGLYTAWSDKHPSYDLVNGPPGDGVDDLYVPEINSVPKSEIPTQAYDTLKVEAVLNEIDGRKSACGVDFNPFLTCASAPVPAILGMNFQVVSVAQKQTATTSPPEVSGGYLNHGTQFSAPLENALQFVDHSLAHMVAELDGQGLTGSTEIIVTAKHGQSPIDADLLDRIDPATIPGILASAGIGVAQATQDDSSLIWLADQSQTATAVAALQASVSAGNPAAIDQILAGKALAKQYGDPAADPRVPDIVVQPQHGVVYSLSTKKQSEHGGGAADDTNVALLLVKPDLAGPRTVGAPVSTTQVAPTILDYLGLDPHALQAVKLEHTTALPAAGS